MKIGILTFHRAHNYGAVLQAYALQEILRKHGDSVEIIDYRQPFIEEVYATFSLKRYLRAISSMKIKSIAKEILNVPIRYRKKKIFDTFLNNFLNISSVNVCDNSEMPDDYDLYIHGSDQIWNPKLTAGYDSVYLGDYKSNGKKITYAASFELKPLPEEGKLKFSCYLNNFDAISVREEELIDILSPVIKNKIFNVLDPTLLIDSSFWDNFAVKPDEKKYLLVYQVGNVDITIPLAKNIANRLGLDVVILNEKYKSVEEFVGYFKYASFVISASFHATSFSIIFKKPFYTLATGTSSDIRYISLFKKLEISNRLVTNPNIELSSIDYENVYEKLEKLRNKSFEFISQNINS